MGNLQKLKLIGIEPTRFKYIYIHWSVEFEIHDRFCVPSSSPDRHDISSRLADYFDRKEAASGDVKSRMQQNVRLSPLHDSGARPKTTAATEVNSS